MITITLKHTAKFGPTLQDGQISFPAVGHLSDGTVVDAVVVFDSNYLDRWAAHHSADVVDKLVNARQSLQSGAGDAALLKLR